MGKREGENAEKRDGFGVQFSMPELKLVPSPSLSPSGQTGGKKKNKKVHAVGK